MPQNNGGNSLVQVNHTRLDAMLCFCASAGHRRALLALAVFLLVLQREVDAQTTTVATCIGGLSPQHEIPPVNLVANGTATISFTPGPVDPSKSEDNQTYFVNFHLNQTGLHGIDAAHIHLGNSSTLVGPKLIEFTPVSDFTAFELLGYVSGTLNTSASIAQAILHSPLEYYVNIHTEDNPAGTDRTPDMYEDPIIKGFQGFQGLFLEDPNEVNGAIRGQLGDVDVNPTACPADTSEANGATNSSIGVGVIVGIAAAGLVVVAGLAFLLLFLMRRRVQGKATSLRPLGSAPAHYRGVEAYSMDSLRKATNEFDEKSILGEGGFGIVYKGVTVEGEEVAVKRAKLNSKIDSFDFEIDAISHMAHANVIRLLGFCTDDGEEILVYEFAAHGSLQHHLHPNPTDVIERVPLNFEQRMKIALGTAQGLNYLHNFAKPTTVHRDVKPANILLDADMNAKLADFGLLKKQELATGMTTDVKGTAGYLDPEYYRANRVTAKSDVFGFGVVCLELLTGKNAIATQVNGESVHIKDWASEALHECDIYEVIDPDMGYATVDELEIFFAIAFSCVKKKSKNRPDMQDVTGRLRELQQSVLARIARGDP